MRGEKSKGKSPDLFDIQERESPGVNSLRCAILEGVQAHPIEVEASFTKGLPGFAIVGLAGNDIQEAKERVKAALLGNGYAFPPMKLTVNLSPASTSKAGSQFDLPIALLVALQGKALESGDLYVFGELGLDGRVRSNPRIFPILLSLKEQGLVRRAMVPAEAMEHLAKIPGIEYLPVENLNEAVERLGAPSSGVRTSAGEFGGRRLDLPGGPYYALESYPEDFAQVRGQEIAKRAAQIAAAGMHNFLMEGSPGCGKSMIAKRLRYILPPMSEAEILSTARQSFLEGRTPDFAPLRPYRSPHHTATPASIFGGGSKEAKIGEVGLANNGILFFDELPHFSKQVLEALREPLQDRQVHIARVHSKVSYEADFMFVAAMNPCPCGNLLSESHTCRCSEAEIQRYRNRLSDPFLDRIDLFVTMQEVSPEDRGSRDSASMHREVIEAFAFQKERGQERLNGKLNEEEVERYCQLDREAREILDRAVTRFGLSHRSIVSIKKVARTIADLERSEHIGKKHLLEALNYRRRK